jgi:AraC-like DNA-binding protein
MICRCRKCQREFHAAKQRRIYCSRLCKNAAERKIDLKKLAWFAFQGLDGKDIAQAFGVSRPRVSRALRAHGLYAQWREQRYA